VKSWRPKKLSFPVLDCSRKRKSSILLKAERRRGRSGEGGKEDLFANRG